MSDAAVRAESSMQEALRQLNRGEYAGGARQLQALLAPRSALPAQLVPDARSNLGTALWMLSRADEAEVAYGAALRLRPLASVRFNLGLLCAEQRRTAEAEAHYRESIALEPKSSAGAYNNLGILVRTRPGGAAEATDMYRSALRADPRHASAYNNLANMLKAESRDAEAGAAYASAVALSPRYLEAYVNLGHLLKEKPAWRPAAVRAYRVALELKHAHRSVLLNLGETLQWLGAEAAANVTFSLGVARGVWQHPQQRPSHLVPGLEAKPWWDKRRLPWIETLLGHVDTLRAEGLKLLRDADAFKGYLSPALSAGNWSDVTLLSSGMRQPGSLLAPASYRLLRSLGSAVNSMVLGSAYFSRMSAGSRLRAHCGPSNSRLRVHVGLHVPKGASLRVANESRQWREGGALVFDDSFEHEVWNDAPDDERLIFIVDAWHPDLSSEAERRGALESQPEEIRRRYERVLAWERAGSEWPVEPDQLADRRLAVVF